MALLQVTITDAGRAEIINAEATGTAPVEITEIGIGTGQYNPNATQTALQNEIKRLTAISGVVVSDDVIHVIGRDDSADIYAVSEFGLYTESGTLFAVYSQTSGPFANKAAQSAFLLAVDILLTTLDATSITFGDTNFVNPPASSTTPGSVIIQENQTDDTPGAVLLPGAWGLGKILPIADADSALRSGFYSLPAFLGAGNSPMAGVSGNLLVVNGGADDTYVTQLWTQSNDSDFRNMYQRHRRNSTWTSWRRIQSMDTRELATGGGVLVPGMRYHITDSEIYFLPIVTSLPAGTSVVISKALSAEPGIQVQGSERIQTTRGDTFRVVFDINSEIVLVWNGTDWEV